MNRRTQIETRNVSDILECIEATQRESIGNGDSDDRADITARLYQLDAELHLARTRLVTRAANLVLRRAS